MKLKEEQFNEKGRFPQEFSWMTSRKEGGGHFDTWYLLCMLLKPMQPLIEIDRGFETEREKKFAQIL